MERASRSDLIATVSSQKEKLEKYEAKLKDLVHAYRGLVKEKEALEATVSVLSTTTPSSVDSSPELTSDPLNVQAANGEEKPKATDSNVDSEKVKILTTSVATLSQEKSRLKTIYIAEKKQLKQENEDLQQTLENERGARNTEITELTGQIQEMKGKIRKQQHEREKEQTDHVVMLRELQKLLGEERIAKEKIELEYDEMRFTVKEVEKELKLCQESQEKVGMLNKEIEQLKKMLRLTQEKAEQAERPSPLIEELRQEIADINLQHNKQMLNEQQRANDAVDKVSQSANQDEARVSNLEAKISELSVMIGDYERIRNQDQQSSQRLRERLSQLDAENSALTEAMACHKTDTIDRGLGAHQLAEKISSLVDLLKTANESSDAPVDLQDLLGSDEGKESAECRRYREELGQVREEYECYKLRAQSVLKNRNCKDSNVTREIDTLKSQVMEMKEKLRGAYSQCDELQTRHDKKLEESRQNLVKVQESHKQEVARLQADQRQQTADLELELRKQRARTVSLLAEKDRDLEQLRHLTSVPRFDTEAWLDRNAGASEEVVHGPLMRTRSQEEQAVASLMNQSLFSSQHESMLYVHFSEEQARKDVELNTLRKHRRQLESTVRDMQSAVTATDEQYTERVESLEEEVRKQQRDKSRENANLEYLKNVTYRFLTSTDLVAKERMLNAIATILQFSPTEKQLAHSHKSTWW